MRTCPLDIQDYHRSYVQIWNTSMYKNPVVGMQTVFLVFLLVLCLLFFILFYFLLLVVISFNMLWIFLIICKNSQIACFLAHRIPVTRKYSSCHLLEGVGQYCITLDQNCQEWFQRYSCLFLYVFSYIY